jgi:hypothetical protein
VELGIQLVATVVQAVVVVVLLLVELGLADQALLIRVVLVVLVFKQMNLQLMQRLAVAVALAE